MKDGVQEMPLGCGGEDDLAEELPVHCPVGVQDGRPEVISDPLPGRPSRLDQIVGDAIGGLDMAAKAG
jgi:hypothetical protein